MDNVSEPFKIDNDNLLYLDGNDVKIKSFIFSTDLCNAYSKKRRFYQKNGIDNYIVKDTTGLPKYFNESKNMKLIKGLSERQEKVSSVDFPIGYYQEYNKYKGMIIPLYKQGLSLRFLLNSYTFYDLTQFYHHHYDETANLVILSLHILKTIEEMYKANISYLDINCGNFLVYNNSIKVIDFEPDYVILDAKRNKYLKRILQNYADLICYVWSRYGYKHMILNPGDDFDETKEKVKCLIREKRM